jgi:DegV family protein with EDD domain
MRKILFSTDQVCDVEENYFKKHNVLVLPLTYSLDGVEYDNVNKQQLPTVELFQKMKEGAVPKTSQTNPEVVKKFFVQKINEGYDIFHLSTSTGITGTHQSVLIAIDEIKNNKETLLTKENQNYQIVAMDSLTGAGGAGMLLDKLIQFKKEQKCNLEQLKQEAERLIPMCCHYFTLDNLKHLARGGRISKGKAIVGSILQVKPLLHMDEHGVLLQIGQTIGRRKSLKALVDLIDKKMIREINDTIYISHGDCLEDIAFLKDEIVKRLGKMNFMVSLASPIVGAHVGPGAVGVFFLAKDRLEPTK